MSEFDPKNVDEPKKPEFIILEEGYTERTEGFGGFHAESEDILKSFQKMSRSSYPVSIRILMLFSSFLTLIISIFAGVVLVIAVALNTIVFFQVPTLQRFLKAVWKNFRRLLVFTLGFAVAVFAPPFGFGIIMLYFMLYADKMANEFLKKMMR